MPGALDAAFRKAAKDVVKELGSSLDVEIDYVREVSGDYNVTTGTYTELNQTYSGISAPIEFVRSEEEEGREERKARVYISPDQIGGNQPTFQDGVTLKFAGSSHATQIIDIQTFRGGQEYLYILLVKF